MFDDVAEMGRLWTIYSLLGDGDIVVVLDVVDVEDVCIDSGPGPAETGMMDIGPWRASCIRAGPVAAINVARAQTSSNEVCCNVMSPVKTAVSTPQKKRRKATATTCQSASSTGQTRP